MTRRRWLLLAACIAAGAAAIAIGVPWGRSLLRARALHGLSGANVLLVTLDTTRADRIGCYGHADAETPALDGIARDGVRFERCVTPTAYTLPSHASIMTGRWPAHHGVRLNGGVALADAQVTLAERLSAHGYRTGAFVGAFVLDGRWGLEQGFERYEDDFDLRPGQRLDLAGVQRPGDKVVDAAMKWLEEDAAKPFFAWVHLYDPHTPYEPPEPFKSRFAGGPSRRYDGEIAFADSQVARLLDWLRLRGLDGRTAVVVVGDHGEGLGDHGESEHGYFVYDYSMHVPLLLRLPAAGLRGVRVAAQVRTIDLFPTILELVAPEAAAESHGASLVSLLTDPTRAIAPYAYSESVATEQQYGWSALYSLSTSRYKLIEAPRRELYDLAADPHERDNVIATLPRVAGEMAAELAKLREAMAAGAPATQEANIDDETMRRLAALGYVGGTVTSSDDRPRPDPKDMLHLYEAIGVANQLIYTDDHAGAVKQLERVLAEDPRNPQARYLLAMSYDHLGREEEARVVLDEILKESPDDVRSLIAMAGILLQQGTPDEVIAVCRRALAEDERNTQAMALIADVYMEANDHAAALPLLEKAVEIQPKLTRNRNNLAACLIGLGRLDAAETELKGILEKHPKFPLTHFNLGLLYEGRGRLAEARQAYTTEVELHPGCVPARFNLGNLALRTGDAAAAEEQMRDLVTRAPDEPRPYLFLARVLIARGGDLDEALASTRKGLERARGDELKALAYYLMADIYSRQRRPAELDAALAKARRHEAAARSRRAS